MVYQQLEPAQTERANAAPVVSFVGRSNTGKTSLLEIVIREMTNRGYRVAAIKHSHHDFQMDRPGKDTWRLAAAGSQAVAISSPTQMALVARPETELSLSDIQLRIGAGMDVILAEGYKQSGVAKVRVVRDPASDDGLADLSDVLLTVSPEYADDGRPCFRADDVAAIIEILLDRIADRRGEIEPSTATAAGPAER